MVCKLAALTKLALRGNQLEDLPSELEGLKKLESLDLSFNKYIIFCIIFIVKVLEKCIINNKMK